MGDRYQEPMVQYDGETGQLVIGGDLGRLVWGAVAESLDGAGSVIETSYHSEYCADVLGQVAAAAENQLRNSNAPDEGRHPEAA